MEVIYIPFPIFCESLSFERQPGVKLAFELIKPLYDLINFSVTLARACCDRIEELAPFRSDARPTWLFLSSGVPTALLRGMNRPLLTKVSFYVLSLKINFLGFTYCRM